MSVIKNGEWFRYGKDGDYAKRATEDFCDDGNGYPCIRVIVRDAKPRRTLSKSDALTWLEKVGGVACFDGLRKASGDQVWNAYVRGSSNAIQAWGSTMVQAVARLRKAMGVK